MYNILIYFFYYFISELSDSDLNKNNGVSQPSETDVLHVNEQNVELFSSKNSIFNNTVTSE